MDNDDNVWVWALGGPALIGMAVWSALVFAADVQEQVASKVVEPVPMTMVETAGEPALELSAVYAPR